MKRNKILARDNQYGKNKEVLLPNYRDELVKDKWDVRKLGIPYNKTRGDHFLSFEKIPFSFRDSVKKYVTTRLIEMDSIQWNTARQDVHRLNVFLGFYAKLHPDQNDLRNMTRSDFISYVDYLRNNPMGGSSPSQYRNQPPTNYYIWSMVANVENYITYMQRFDWDEAPLKPSRSLIFQEDRPKLEKKKITEYEYVDDHIWEQITDKLPDLDSQYLPIVILMEATGFHLIDILNLRLNCLQIREDGYWIVSERNKIKYIPISEEIYNMVKAQQIFIRDRFPYEQNSEQYLFLKYKGKFKDRGKPYLQPSILRQLNFFAEKHRITDQKGKVFRFGSLTFRHRYGVKKINDGATILDVQKLLSNVTPEMAVIYAKIHDHNLQVQWDYSNELGAVRLDPLTGEVIQTQIYDQAYENNVDIDWLKRNLGETKLEQGYCIKSPRTHCQYLSQTLEQPCMVFKCSSFYIDSTFLPYYIEQIQTLQKQIEEGKQQGRSRYVEILQGKLDKYIEIREAFIKIPKLREEHIG
ncbi:recombinase XerD [Paenibacillus anaericanus]|uniref:Recombinase XerD n=1 Tax=Paenibacillus anaericanus TaxID=170367 RepID=A0A433YBZ2_9BACL|nr:tyrosine-type recombinase/integrase [Paenibacillus anaericanus]RUT47381.1 recombinase XerD [Paenibacillus anaericanus]